MSLDLRKLKLTVIRIHTLYFFSSRCSQNLTYHSRTMWMYVKIKMQNDNNTSIKLQKILRHTLIISTSWSTPLSPGNNGCTWFQTQPPWYMRKATTIIYYQKISDREYIIILLDCKQSKQSPWFYSIKPVIIEDNAKLMKTKDAHVRVIQE